MASASAQAQADDIGGIVVARHGAADVRARPPGCSARSAPVESNSVPSQSKAIRSKRRGRVRSVMRRSVASKASAPTADARTSGADGGAIRPAARPAAPRNPPAAARRVRCVRRRRVIEVQAPRMQEHALRSAARHRASRASALLSSKSPYLSSPAIGWPCGARCTRIWWVRPVLMVTSSKVHAASTAPATHLDQRDRTHASGSSWSATTRTRRSPSACRYLCSGSVDHLRVGRPGARDQRQVGLAGLALAELVLQLRQRAALLGHQQDAGGLAVEPVHQFQEVAPPAAPCAAARSRRS